MANVLVNKTSFMERNDECSHEQIQVLWNVMTNVLMNKTKQVLWNVMTNVLMNKTSFMERNDECSHEQNKFYET